MTILVYCWLAPFFVVYDIGRHTFCYYASSSDLSCVDAGILYTVYGDVSETCKFNINFSVRFGFATSSVFIH